MQLTMKNAMGYVLWTVTIVLTCSAAVTAQTIYGCANNSTGQLRRINPPDQCKTNELPVNWSTQGPQGIPGPAGPTGPAGPAGTALAYALVNSDGSIVAESSTSNVTVTNILPGTYCVGVSGGTPRVAVANLDSRLNLGGGSVETGIFHSSACTASGNTQGFVVTRIQNAVGGLAPANSGFYIIIL